MLRLTVSTEEYLMIGEDIRLVFLGGTGKHLRIMVDAPRDKNIVRSTVLERKVTDPEERAKLPRYYAQEEHPEKYVRKDSPGKGAEAAVKARDGADPETGKPRPEEGSASGMRSPETEKRGAPDSVSNVKRPKMGKKSRIIITQGNAGSR